ncbi:MAG: M56 family metallopeptidase [Lawsonibacter sp.]|nr:M56 family metallopeptidase [Lawsonibacter sp.]
MNQTLLTLGALTLGGSAAAALLALAARLPKPRYGAKWRCRAWLLLCLRLALPLPLLPQAEEHAPIQVDLPNPPAAVQPAAPAASASAEAFAPGFQTDPAPPGQPWGPNHKITVEPPGKKPIDPAAVLLGLWLAGAAAMLAWSGWAHLRFLSYLLRWSAPVTDGAAVATFNQLGDQLGLDRRPRLLVCQGLKVPTLAGLFHPALLLPQGDTTGEELGFSLLHELTHYRRRDIWLKTLALWVNALHWFNPLMWYMVRLVERDTELACDEDALRRLSPDAYAAYGQTILNAVARLQQKAD